MSDPIINEVVPVVPLADIPEEEMKAFAAEGLNLEGYVREVSIDPSVPRELQRLLTLALRYIPPSDPRLKGEIEGALSWRFD